MGLLEARETAEPVRVDEVREEAERVLAELQDAEAVLERRAIALAEPVAEEPPPPPGPSLRPEPARGAPTQRDALRLPGQRRVHRLSHQSHF
jgi:hypothetical protein